eukprot:180289-Chlamydomonas_euryale.AAC.3
MTSGASGPYLEARPYLEAVRAYCQRADAAAASTCGERAVHRASSRRAAAAAHVPKPHAAARRGARQKRPGSANTEALDGPTGACGGPPQQSRLKSLPAALNNSNEQQGQVVWNVLCELHGQRSRGMEADKPDAPRSATPSCP